MSIRRFARSSKFRVLLLNSSSSFPIDHGHSLIFHSSKSQNSFSFGESGRKRREVRRPARREPLRPVMGVPHFRVRAPSLPHTAMSEDLVGHLYSSLIVSGAHSPCSAVRVLTLFCQGPEGACDWWRLRSGRDDGIVTCTER